jgi:hypothetical protein
MIKSKTNGVKNKVCKPQGAIMHLTQTFISKPLLNLNFSTKKKKEFIDFERKFTYRC